MSNPIRTASSKTPEVPDRGMPVTIITGFLGSGKTTLLNQILENRQGLKVAVLMNELGDIDIDSQLLVEIDENMVQLSNGCICCTINDSLVKAIYSILERKDPIDYLVIETTGVADPLPIMMTLLATDLRELLRLDSILTVVDAEAFTPKHFDSEVALNQILYGDIILLNKIDLVSSEIVNQQEDYIRSIKENARILRSHCSKVPLSLILDVGYANTEDCASKIKNNHQHHHSENLDNDGFISVSFKSDRPFELTKFQAFLDRLPADVFRAKGIVSFQESQLRHIFQLSGNRCTLTVDRHALPNGVQAVFIGRNIQPDKIRQQLSQCLGSKLALSSST